MTYDIYGQIIEDNLKHRESEYWSNLYQEYLESYRLLRKVVNKIRKQYTNTTDKDKIKERKIVYDMEKEMVEKLIYIEEYLPIKDRYYTNKKIQELANLTFNKSSNTGLVPIDNKNNENNYNTEKLVHDKLFKKSLLKLLASILTQKQYRCLYMYYYRNMIQEEIASKLGIDRSTVAHYIQDALDKIRVSEEMIGLIEYLLK